MKLQYYIEIHCYPDDEKKKNQTLLEIHWRKENGKTVSGEFNYCCSDMKKAFSVGYITTAISKIHFRVQRDERSESLKEPVACLKTFDEDYDYESGLDEYNLPIKFCPFCAEEIIFELVEKKKITHTCKKIIKSYESCDDETKEEIIFSKTEKK